MNYLQVGMFTTLYVVPYENKHKVNKIQKQKVFSINALLKSSVCDKDANHFFSIVKIILRGQLN